MTEGYALIAHPERFGDTGVMSFIVSRDGVATRRSRPQRRCGSPSAISA
ncbi:MAG: DUF2950 family protein [Betaproteobacteria bacterium]|nr:DUF2950 family protein [Betaproteobacteria bacterium]